MKKLMVLALVAPLLAGCGNSGDGCPESLPALEAGQVAGMLPMPAAPPPPRPPAPAPRPAAPAPKPAAPAPKAPPAPPKPAAPKPAPRYNAPPPRPYVPPRVIAPQHTTVIHQQDPVLSSPFFWMLMMENSSLHNTAHTEGCAR